LEDFVRYVEAMPRNDVVPLGGGDIAVGHYEPVLRRALEAQGVKVLAQYPVGPYRIDLGVIQNATRLAIEVDGEAFHDNSATDRLRDLRLRSAGWIVLRIPAADIRANLPQVVKRVRQALTPALSA